MPIDPVFADSILGTFRTMAKEVTDKGASGPDYDTMMTAMNRMEQLAREMDDLNDFNGAMMQENLYFTFSNAYGQVLGALAAPKYQVQGNEYGEAQDQQLLNQTLNAYRDAVNKLIETKKENIQRVGAQEAKLFDEESYARPVREVIALGESGYSYPQFLSEMIKRGLDKAMEGATANREVQLYTLNYYKAGAFNPLYIQREQECIDLFDSLKAKSVIGVPEPFQYSLGVDAIHHKYEGPLEKWNAIRDHWEKILDNLSWWTLSWCSFATTIEPWSMAENPRAAVRETQECNPGELGVLLRQFQDYFSLNFEAIFTHETFVNEVQGNFLWYSQEYIDLIRNEIFPAAKPGGSPSSQAIAKAEDIYRGDRMRNPELHLVNERWRKFYNGFFGEGYYEKKFPSAAPEVSKAAPWRV